MAKSHTAQKAQQPLAVAPKALPAPVQPAAPVAAVTAPIVTQDLNDAGACCVLSIGSWSGRVPLPDAIKERIKASAELQAVDPDLLSMGLRIAPKEVLREANNVANRARYFTYESSMPSPLEGWNWVRVEDSPKVDATLKAFQQEYWDTINTAVAAKRPEIMAWIDEKFAGSFTSEELTVIKAQVPTRIEDRYSFAWYWFNPVLPTNMPAEVVASAREKYTAFMDMTLKGFRETLEDALGDILTQMVETLNSAGKRITAPTLAKWTNFLKQEFPKFNGLVNSPTLAEFVERAKTAIAEATENESVDTNLRARLTYADKFEELRTAFNAHVLPQRASRPLPPTAEK